MALTPTSQPLWNEPQRQQQFQTWISTIKHEWDLDIDSVQLASADASTRRYLRIWTTDAQQARIIMDAPPQSNDISPFLRIAHKMQQAHLPGPQVLASDSSNGWVLLSDLGNTPLLSILQAEQHEMEQGQSAYALSAAPVAPQSQALMQRSVQLLVQWQTQLSPTDLPSYDRAFMQRELDLFPQWCVQAYFKRTWTAQEQAIWDNTVELLCRHILAMPHVPMHRDWMPRNFMVTPNATTGQPDLAILDFQDTILGPIGYDMISLLRDAFISWPEEHELDWAVRYWQSARQNSLPVPDDFGEFWRCCEWMGLQRHLKVMGIFCRLHLRDNKTHYSEDLPRFFQYATRVAMRYAPLKPLLTLLEPLSGHGLSQGYTF